MKPSYQTSLKALDKWMTTFGWEPEHMRQVARLAVSLFDRLTPLHRLGAEDRFLLEAAAIVHDVGFPSDEARHHKRSFSLIMGRTFPGIDARQQAIIALLARYHRKAEPKMKHTAFAALTEEDRLRVERLAAILRIADGLDRTHTNAVRSLDCRIEDAQVTISLKTPRNPIDELFAGRKKAALFEKVFRRKVVFDVVDL